MTETNSAGKFIVIEGIDGAGKSTQIELLSRQLEAQGLHCYVTREPSDRPIGKLIRRVITKDLEVSPDTLAALFLADRLDHVQNKEDGILKHINEGIHVISDRYYWSSYAYHSLDLNMDWVIDLNHRVTQILRPDITIFLDLTADKSFERISANRTDQDLFEKQELLTQIRNNYLKAFKRMTDTEHFTIIDADKELIQLAEEIWYAVEPILFD